MRHAGHTRNCAIIPARRRTITLSGSTLALTQPRISERPTSDTAQSGSERRFDLRSLLLIAGAALLGAGWAIYNRAIAPSAPDQDAQLHALVWVIFATPFATFWGWF